MCLRCRLLSFVPAWIDIAGENIASQNVHNFFENVIFENSNSFVQSSGFICGTVYFGPYIDSPKHKFSDARWTSRWKFWKFSGAHCDLQERETFIKMQMNVGNKRRYSWYKVTDGATGKLNGKIQKINFCEQTKQAILHEMLLK